MCWCWCTIELLDVSDPLRPKFLSLFRLRETVLGVHLVGSTAYVAAGSLGLLVVDLSDPGAPRFELRVDTPGSVHDVAVQGSFAMLALVGCDVDGQRRTYVALLDGVKQVVLEPWPVRPLGLLAFSFDVLDPMGEPIGGE